MTTLTTLLAGGDVEDCRGGGLFEKKIALHRRLDRFDLVLVFVEEPLTDVDVGRSQVMVSSCLSMTIGIGQWIRGYCRLRSYPIDRWSSDANGLLGEVHRGVVEATEGVQIGALLVVEAPVYLLLIFHNSFRNR
ncbi:hypothetical protein TYRP_018107 [Tyrophagus putrescentiae]|nr:hypothetical protein TYRP_018107 [Tyrophagus putrescentiae]